MIIINFKLVKVNLNKKPLILNIMNSNSNIKQTSPEMQQQPESDQGQPLPGLQQPLPDDQPQPSGLIAAEESKNDSHAPI